MASGEPRSIRNDETSVEEGYFCEETWKEYIWKKMVEMKTVDGIERRCCIGEGPDDNVTTCCATMRYWRRD